MLHERLKEETLPSHQALEKAMVRKIKNFSTTKDYADFLKMMYGFQAPLEAKIGKFLSDDVLVDFQNRRKASVILDDINQFEEVGPIDVCKELPSFQDAAGALGALYVLEGSTMGGKFVAKMITNQLKLENNKGVSYFLSYGDNTQRMWESFKANLARPFNDDEQDEIIRAADETFSTFKNWIN